MNAAISNKLKQLVTSVEALSEDSQHVLMQELEERVAELTTPQTTSTQRAEIQRRLTLPRQYVSNDDVQAILGRYISRA